MDAANKRPVGTTTLGLSQMGFGAAPLGNLFTPLSEKEAFETIQAALAAGIRYFDTAPFYGHGLSEHRLSTALRAVPRDDFTLSTKVGRLLVPGQSYDLVDEQFHNPCSSMRFMIIPTMVSCARSKTACSASAWAASISC